jgi:hypothetical protein
LLVKAHRRLSVTQGLGGPANLVGQPGTASELFRAVAKGRHPGNIARRRTSGRTANHGSRRTRGDRADSREGDSNAGDFVHSNRFSDVELRELDENATVAELAASVGIPDGSVWIEGSDEHLDRNARLADTVIASAILPR